MPKRREIAEFCRFVESDPIEKNYNEDTGEDDIKILGKGEALPQKAPALAEFNQNRSSKNSRN